MPEIRATACVRYRYRYSDCSRCSEACPHDAISLSEEGATLIDDRCRGCDLCVAACRTGAWSSPDFKPVELLREAITKREWRFACEPSGCKGDAVVPCLGAVDATWLAYMAKRRIPVSLHGAGHCAECVHGSTGAAQLTSNLEAVQLLRQAAVVPADGAAAAADWTMPALVEDCDSSRRRGSGVWASPLSVARRRLLQRILRPTADRRDGDDSGARPQVPDRGIRAAAYVSSEQRDLLQIVCKQKDAAQFSIASHEALPLLQLHMQQGCTLCEACFRVCPTGALAIVENPGDWALTFQIDRCVGCEVCLEACQPQALHAATAVDPRPDRPPVALIAQAKQRCSRCDRHFVSAAPQSTCPVCADDEEAFAKIFS